MTQANARLGFGEFVPVFRRSLELFDLHASGPYRIVIFKLKARVKRKPHDRGVQAGPGGGDFSHGGALMSNVNLLAQRRAISHEQNHVSVRKYNFFGVKH